MKFQKLQPKVKKLLFFFGFIFVGLVFAIYTHLWNQAEKKMEKKEALQWEQRRERLLGIEETQQELANKIREFAGDGSCESSSECKVIGLGAKICGEYRNYFYYSKKTVDEIKFFDAIGSFNQNEENLNKESFKAQKCGVKAEEAVCFYGRCVPRSSVVIKQE